MKWLEPLLFRLTIGREDDSTAVLVSALGISNVGFEWVQVNGLLVERPLWSRPYGNNYSSNPLRGDWKACRWLAWCGLMQQGNPVKTDFRVTEFGIRYLRWYAKRAEDTSLLTVLDEVDLGK